jgi:hypothetical protein
MTENQAMAAKERIVAHAEEARAHRAEQLKKTLDEIDKW